MMKIKILLLSLILLSCVALDDDELELVFYIVVSDLESDPSGYYRIPINKDNDLTKQPIYAYVGYKDFDNFMSITDDLWKTRKDFKVWIPLLNKPNRDYGITDKFDKALLRQKLQGFKEELQYLTKKLLWLKNHYYKNVSFINHLNIQKRLIFI